MRINSVYLKNFRAHKELTCEFAPGMNLLLGQNGSGKSSILEAIGITLFDSKYRDGSSKGQEQVIKFGATEALVIIEFADNEGNLHIIENQLKKGSGYKRLYRKDDRESMIESKDEVNKTLKSLVGIEGDLGGIYDNIIVAKQNEFINLYKLKDADRKRTFDGIFETDIYDKIYKGFSKDTGDRYKSELEKTKARLEVLKSKAENPQEILEKLAEAEKSKILVDENLKKEEEIKKSLEKNIAENSDLEKKIERAETDIEGEIKILETQKEAQAETSKEIEHAKKSFEILNENHENHEKYCKIQEETLEKKEKIIVLEEGVTSLRDKELETKNLEKKIIEIFGEIEKEKIHIISNRDNFERVKKLKSQEEENLFLIQKREIDLITEEKNIIPLIVAGEILDKEIKKIDSTLEIQEAKLSQERAEYRKTVERLEIFKKEELKIKIKNLEKKQDEKIVLQGELNKILALLENSREAEKKLATSMCPYLNEKCKNLENSLNTEEFFREREQEFLKSLENVKKSIVEVTMEVNSLEFLKKKFIEEGILKESRANIERAIENREKEIEFTKLQKENSALKRENFQKENGVLEKLNERKIALIEEKKYLNAEALRENIKKINLEILGLENSLEILEMRKKSLEKLYGESLKKVEVIQNRVMELKPYIALLENEKKNLLELEKELGKLKISYELYNRNLDMALKLENYREKRDRVQENIERIKLGLEKLKENLLNFRKESEKKISLVSLHEEKNSVEDRIGYLNRESGSLLNILMELKEKAKKSQEDYQEIITLEESKEILQKKFNLTMNFRDNVKGMGEKVAANIIERIAFFSTENFRKITGRAESIIWSGKDSSDKASPYSVVLLGADRDGNIKKVDFDQLSGGEQVAVAISIRGAMNSIFTKTGFSIFDEPTNNLDQERRKILADNIGEILKDMEQSIIVTHDDTFKEMAQQVIEL